ncbi:hypothetical protein BGZ60DRAFT_533332 [Tricladium varicosporioides]|nr:hypothetical protein BGZ60DRAFT_533332 [Hymenoscyphus varicosporioides]
MDLWATAAAQMSDEDRNNINFSYPDKLKILSDLLQDTEKSRQECIMKRWRYTRKSGETVIFVDLLGKIVKWIDLFKQIGDTAIQYNPIHAALPWAGVRFLLQIAINDSDKFAFVVEVSIPCYRGASESSSKVIYGDNDLFIKGEELLQTELYKLKSRLLAKSDIELYFSIIAITQETVDRCSCVVGMEEQINQRINLKKILECIDGPIKRMSTDLKGISDSFQCEERSATWYWTVAALGSSFYKVKERKCIFYLVAPWNPRLWEEQAMIEDAKKSFQNGQNPAPVFFYCSRNTAEPARSNPDAIIANIARQLSSFQPGDPLLPPMVAAYKKREIEGFASGSLGIDESRTLILQLTDYYPLTTIVIDALDECDPERRPDLLDTLELILQESSSLVKVFVSSRRDHDIVLNLRDYPNLELSSEKNKDDISSFVTTETNNLIRRKKLLALSTNKEELKVEIIEQVTKKADGMFRWASLQLQSLCSVRTNEAIRERLGQLPPKLEDLYLELYETLTKTSADTDREITIGTFSWLLCAQRTLTSAEFLAALSTTPRQQFNHLTKEHILEMCANMVVFDPALDTFRFAHLSVREFLEKRPEYTREAANALAAETCLLDVIRAAENPVKRKCLSNYKQDFSNATLSQGFTQYSTFYWAPLCQLAANRRTTGVLKDLLCHFLSNDSDPRSAVIAWASRVKEQLHDYSVGWDLRRRLQDSEAHNSQSLFIACCFDLPEIVRLQMNVVNSLVNVRGKAALYIAVQYTSCKVISILINDKLMVIAEEVLKAAAGNEKSGKELMRLLLEQRGTDVVITEGVLKAAAENRRSGKEVMRLLLEERGTDVVITKEVLKAAAGNKRSGEGVMRLLLEQRGTDVVITEGVLKAAAGNKRSGEGVMRLLLEQRGTDVVITKEVLKAAAGNWRSGEKVMRLLLEQRGTDVVITKEVLKAEAGNWRSGEEVMRLLLEQRGTDVVITKEVLKAASGNGQSWKELMRLFLEQRGTDGVITGEVAKVAAGSLWSGKQI